MRTKVALVIVTAFVAVLAISGCGDTSAPQKSSNAAPTPSGGDTLPPNFMLKETPTGAKNVGQLKKEGKEGEEVVIRGQVGGRAEVFTADRAAFLIADMKFPACNTKPGDKCETPWDFCCETPEALKDNTATIQILDAQGKLLKANLKGINGIDHLSVLVVKGTVAKREGQNLVINATGIFVEKRQN